MASILEMKNICKSFNGVPVLKEANFSLEKGHVHSLVGGNGAGKSTLMKIFTGVYGKDSGQILVEGQEVHFKNYEDASQFGIRMIFQELSLVPSLTVYENIFLNQEKKKAGRLLDKSAMKKKSQDLLQSLGMEVSVDAPVSSLSVGYCQMVEIAKALSMDAKILVLDEPTASLSDSEVAMLFQTIRRLQAQGVSMIYISHRMNEILEISDEVSVLRDGKVVVSEQSDRLTVDDIIQHMLGDNASKSFTWVDRTHAVSPEVMLQVKDLSVGTLVQNVSFQVHKGEVVGIAGLMGSGRTEILQSLFGMQKHSAAEIQVAGRPVQIKSVKSAVQAGIALVPEDRRRQGLVLQHSVKENTILPSLDRLKKGFLVDDKKSNQTVLEKIAELNIKTDGYDKRVSLLSGGNQQKIVIAKWLSTGPKVLLLDEPTAGIDVGAKGEITEIIRKFVAQGNSVLMVSSELVELMAVCDRIIVLCKGKITQELNREIISSEEVLQRAIQE